MSGKTFEDVLKEELAKCCDIVTSQQDAELEKKWGNSSHKAICKGKVIVYAGKVI